MDEMKIFDNGGFGQIRVVAIDGEPWFVGKDIAGALGYADTKDAIRKHVDDEDKRLIQKGQNATFNIPTRGLTIINESGLYALIFGSKLESAKRFKQWVTSEILPAIRKTGGYIAGQERMSDSEFIEKVAEIVQKIIAEQGRTIKDTGYDCNPFSPGNLADKQRIKTLNRLAARVSKLCGLKKNKTLHYLYKTIEENLGVDIDSYSEIYRKTSGDGYSSTIDVVCKYDNLYREAVRLCEETIERKQIFG